VNNEKCQNECLILIWYLILEEKALKAFAKKMVKRISVPKGCIMTGQSVNVQEENKVQMAGAFISWITKKRMNFLLERIW
jgi:hypothetical protein